MSLPKEVEIRPMCEADLDEMMAIENEVYPFPWSRGNYADSLRAGHLCQVCRLNTQLIGYFVIMLVLDEAHLLTIAIAARHQNKGWGASLLTQSMRMAAARGATRLWLEVRPSNEKALRLYRHLGFKDVGLRKNYYETKTGRENALVLSHELTEVWA